MKFIPSLSVALICIFFMQACDSSQKTGKTEAADKPVSTEKTMVFDKATTILESKNGQTIRVKLHEQFYAVLNECVGCASVWTVNKIDAAYLKTVAEKSINPSCTNCTGGSHDKVFQFEAVKKGKSTLSFTYFEKVVSVTIDVY